jgi:hypothetical protein
MSGQFRAAETVPAPSGLSDSSRTCRPDGSWGRLTRPETPVVALHAALALAAAGGGPRLETLQRQCEQSSDPVVRDVVTAVCEALIVMCLEQWSVAAHLLEEVLPTLVEVGGSAAQREVVEEMLLLCLVRAGDHAGASAMLSGRFHRRPSPLDRRRLDTVRAPAST